jgi:exosortase/archaeosortase family protein
MIVGLMLSLAGTQFLSVLRLPVGYLFFMLPLFGQAILSLRWPLQLLTARMAVLILQMLSIPAQLNENYVVLPNIILRVASSCSGARYLVSIIAVSIPIAYLTLRRRRNQIALIALALAIGVFANWARVVFIGLWAYSGGQVVHGRFTCFRQCRSLGFLRGIVLAAWTPQIERRSQLPVTSLRFHRWCLVPCFLLTGFLRGKTPSHGIHVAPSFDCLSRR